MTGFQDKRMLANYKRLQDAIPVGTKVKWTTPLFYIDHDGYDTATGTVVSHTERNGMTTVKYDNPSDVSGETLRCMTVVLQPV